MWLTIALAVVALGLVLLAIAALSAWRRFNKMRRAGGRFTRRVGSLSEAAALLSERLAQPDRLGADD